MAVYKIVHKCLLSFNEPILPLFHTILITISIMKVEISVDDVHGIRTRGRRMVGTDKTTELWRDLLTHEY